MGYLDFIQTDEAELFKKLIMNNLTDPISFNCVKDLPKEKGIYFIYDKDILVYIGEAGNGKKQTIRERCMQYLQKGTGRNFRIKLMRNKNILEEEKAIEYIKNNCTIKYIIDSENKKLEHLCIGVFNTIYND